MAENLLDLEALRRRIDEIDDRLQQLLAERVEIVSEIAARKRDGGTIAPHQPAREAEIIRRLIAHNRGVFPPAALVRMWRELLAATVRQQGAFTIAVYAPPEIPGIWDLARDHYGSNTPMHAYRTTGQVIRAVTEGNASVGVLPMPQEGDTDPWWPHLLSTEDRAPHVIARLPFGGRGNARTDGADALAIGRGLPQETGQDRTMFVSEHAPNISRGRIVATLAALGLRCTFLASYEAAGGANTLIEVDSFVGATDPRLDEFSERLGADLHRLLYLGAYAVPLSSMALAEHAAREAAAAGVAAG